ncbi:MAG: metallophosphoesterase [Endomicrobiaceae bacterium]|jgi:Icc-related predicted phosphoesterase|nr:metallophosphoesterase [Endomicrobiaceae bacterium]
MKILAVSDKEDTKLQDFILKKSAAFKDLDFIISCGDLAKNYLEFLVDSLQKEFFFVEGNHPLLNRYENKHYLDKLVTKVYGKDEHFVLGGVNLHSRLEIYGDYILVGFEGSMKYNPGKFQFSEKEMTAVVKRVEKKIRIQNMLDFVLRRKKKKIIVVSHAPIAGIHDKEDLCHRGFKSFRRFLKKFKPLIWFHGHVHYEGQMNDQISKIDDTLVVNVYGFHIVNIVNDKIEVISNIKNFSSF